MRDNNNRDSRFNRNADNRMGNRPMQRNGGNRPAPVRKPTARDLALTAYRDVIHKGAYASQALDRVLEEAQISDEDRRLTANLFFSCIENRVYLEWVLSRFMKSKTETIVDDILVVAAAQLLLMDRIPDHAATDEAVKQTRNFRMEKLTGLVNAILHNLVRERDEGKLSRPEGDDVQALSIACSLSEPVAQALLAAYDAQTVRRIAAFPVEKRAMTIRVNHMRATDAQIESMLKEKGTEYRRGIVNEAILVADGAGLTHSKEYRTGLFSVQGTSSMLAAMAVEAKPMMQILDTCAAPGGKTCYIAEHMNGTGRVYAWDLHAHRAELIKASAKRLGLDNVRPMMHDARETVDSMLESMDAVLVDAPCSGLGVMSDKPDIRFKPTADDFTALQKMQEEILNAAAQHVRRGGLLVYSTCTILPEENEKQVRKFLETHEDFVAETSTRYLPECLRAKCKDGMLQLLPNIDEVEGFFIARMRRK